MDPGTTERTLLTISQLFQLEIKQKQTKKQKKKPAFLKNDFSFRLIINNKINICLFFKNHPILYFFCLGYMQRNKRILVVSEK